MSTTQANLLLRRQAMELSKNPLDLFSAGLVNQDNSLEWDVIIFGPAGTIYEGGIFPAKITFTEDYPISPPTVKFTTDMWHPNVYLDGTVCMSLLNPPGDDPFGYELACERWNPVHTVETIVLSVVSLLCEPNDQAAANVDAAIELRQRRDDFTRKVLKLVRNSQEQFFFGEYTEADQFLAGSDTEFPKLSSDYRKSSKLFSGNSWKANDFFSDDHSNSWEANDFFSSDFLKAEKLISCVGSKSVTLLTGEGSKADELLSGDESKTDKLIYGEDSEADNLLSGESSRGGKLLSGGESGADKSISGQVSMADKYQSHEDSNAEKVLSDEVSNVDIWIFDDGTID